MRQFLVHLSQLLMASLIAGMAMISAAQAQVTEIHDRISEVPHAPNNRVALTLDACSGKFDEDVILFLRRNRIPATIFATKKWLLNNPSGVAMLKANLDLFDIETALVTRWAGMGQNK